MKFLSSRPPALLRQSRLNLFCRNILHIW
jgi:hypothetical protein